MPEEKGYLTVEEAADRLGVNPRTIRAYIKSGELQAIQLKREYRIFLKDWEAYLKSRRVQPQQEQDKEE